jgi:hypothetical protein
MSGHLIESFDVLTTLSAQRIVVASTSNANTVQYPDTVTSLPLGVTVDTVLDTTNAIPVQMNGLAYVLFNDTMTSGGLVASDTNGRGIPFSLAMTSTALSRPSAYIGIYVGPALGATGGIGKVAIHPGFDRVSG